MSEVTLQVLIGHLAKLYPKNVHLTPLGAYKLRFFTAKGTWERSQCIDAFNPGWLDFAVVEYWLRSAIADEEWYCELVLKGRTVGAVVRNGWGDPIRVDVETEPAIALLIAFLRMKGLEV